MENLTNYVHPGEPLARAKKDGAGNRVVGAVKTHSAPASSSGGVLKNTTNENFANKKLKKKYNIQNRLSQHAGITEGVADLVQLLMGLLPGLGSLRVNEREAILMPLEEGITEGLKTAKVIRWNKENCTNFR